MNFPDVLSLRAELSRRGVQLERRGDKLVCLPKGAAGELLPEVARFKPSLIELLERERTERHDHERLARVARAVLESRRPGGGFDFGRLRPHWHAAGALTGQVMDSPTLAQWARGVCAEGARSVLEADFPQ